MEYYQNRMGEESMIGKKVDGCLGNEKEGKNLKGFLEGLVWYKSPSLNGYEDDCSCVWSLNSLVHY